MRDFETELDVLGYLFASAVQEEADTIGPEPVAELTTGDDDQ